jgi:hypothetical protein
MSAEEKAPWKAAAVTSKNTLTGVDWSDLATKAKRCKTFIRFVASLQALAGTIGLDKSGLPPRLRLFL